MNLEWNTVIKILSAIVRSDNIGIDRKDGCFAEYLTLPIENLVEVPDCVSDENAVFAEPLAAAFEILEQVELNPEVKCLLFRRWETGDID